MRLNFDQEKKLFSAGEKTAYLLHGEYEFLQKELAMKIVRFLLPEDEIENSLLRFDADDDKTLDAIADTASVPSLFGDTQVLLVYDAQNLVLVKDDAGEGKKNLTDHQKFKNYRAFEKLEEAVAGPPGSARLIFLVQGALRAPSGKGGKSRTEKIVQRLYAAIDENGAIVEFPRMYDDDLFGWLMGRASKMGIRWAPRQAEMFMEWTGKDVRHMVNELEKLAAMFPEGGEITDGDMRRLVTSCEDFFVNYLIDFMLDRRPKAALRMLDHSLERGQHPVFILSMIASRLRQMWQARFLLDRGCFSGVPKEYGSRAKQTILHQTTTVPPDLAAAIARDKKDSILTKTPFALFHLFSRARNYSLGEIENALRRAGDVDRKLKAISRPKLGTDEIMLQSLIVDIALETTGAAAPS